MRRILSVALGVAGALTFSACAPRPAGVGPAAGSAGGPPAGSGMVVGRDYPYRLSTHCGVVSAEIDGRTFFVDSPTGIRSDAFPDHGARPVDDGTMTLVSHGAAVFRDGDGVTVPFVDHDPVVAGRLYRIDVSVAGPDRLDSTFFAGGLFVPGAVVAGRLHLAPDASSVSGQMQLVDGDTARFATGGAVVEFSRLSQYGCE